VIAVIPTPRFAVGARVWSIDTYVTQDVHPCPDCKDTREWKATSPVGDTFTIKCLRCSTPYAGFLQQLSSLAFNKATYSARSLTVGSVQIDTAHDDPVRYMCHETGVGSGRVYYEKDFFTSEQDAIAEAEVRNKAEQARLDATTFNRISAESAKWPLSAAVPSAWQHDLYDAWFRARQLRELIEELLDGEDHEALPESVEDRLRTELADSYSWLALHPLDALIEAAREVPDPSEKLTAALHLCTPPERRVKADA
jgi:hypothetical protein